MLFLPHEMVFRALGIFIFVYLFFGNVRFKNTACCACVFKFCSALRRRALFFFGGGVLEKKKTECMTKERHRVSCSDAYPGSGRETASLWFLISLWVQNSSRCDVSVGNSQQTSWFACIHVGKRSFLFRNLTQNRKGSFRSVAF